MTKFLKKVLYYGTLVGPFYNFLKDICVNGYAIYINHQEEIETAKMYARLKEDQLEEISVADFLKMYDEINQSVKKGNKK